MSIDAATSAMCSTDPDVSPISSDELVQWAAQLQNIAQAGLEYGHDDFDRERYQQIRDISAHIMAKKSGLSLSTVQNLFCADSGYQTPKSDTSGAVVCGEKILLVRERDGRWAMPGGWCDYDMSPAANTVKELKEEAGLTVTIRHLVAVHSGRRRNALTFPFEVAKFFFVCDAVGGHFEPNIETSESAYFSLNELPKLDVGKCTPEQIALCVEAAHSSSWCAYCD